MTEKTTPAKAPLAKSRRAPKAASADAPAPDAASTPAGERIAKVLSRAGIASRREAERLIEAGEVKVNGKLVTSPALNVTARDKITVSGQPVGAPEPARLWLYYKPEGLVTSASDEKGRDTVFDHLPEDLPRVMSVGRLDLNSEGLLLLTNDGALKRQLELPSTGWLRKYRVRVKGNPTDPELDPLRKGITVEGERFQPMEVVLDRHQGANAWLTVGLREGKNREIRRAMSAIGVTVNRLIRVSYGPFRLNEMKPGEVEEVRARVLKEQLGSLLPGGAEAEAPARPRAPAAGARKRVVTSSAKSGGQTDRASARSGVEPGTVHTAKGRAALKTLSESWSRATTGTGTRGDAAKSGRGNRTTGPAGPAGGPAPAKRGPRTPPSRNGGPKSRG